MQGDFNEFLKMAEGWSNGLTKIEGPLSGRQLAIAKAFRDHLAASPDVIRLQATPDQIDRIVDALVRAGDALVDWWVKNQVLVDKRLAAAIKKKNLKAI